MENNYVGKIIDLYNLDRLCEAIARGIIERNISPMAEHEEQKNAFKSKDSYELTIDPTNLYGGSQGDKESEDYNRALDRLIRDLAGGETNAPAKAKKKPAYADASLSDLLSGIVDGIEDECEEEPTCGEFVSVFKHDNGTVTTTLNDVAIEKIAKQYFKDEQLIFSRQLLVHAKDAADKLFSFLDSIEYDMDIEDRDDAVTDMIEILIEYLLDNSVKFKVPQEKLSSHILREYIDESVCLF